MNVTNQNQSLVRNELGHYFISFAIFLLLVFLFGIIAKLPIDYVNIINTMHSGLCNSTIQ